MKCHVLFYHLRAVTSLLHDLRHESIHSYPDIRIFDHVRKFGNINSENLWPEVRCFELIKIAISKQYVIIPGPNPALGCRFFRIKKLLFNSFSVTDWTVSCSSRKYACSSYADNTEKSVSARRAVASPSIFERIPNSNKLICSVPLIFTYLYYSPAKGNMAICSFSFARMLINNLLLIHAHHMNETKVLLYWPLEFNW